MYAFAFRFALSPCGAASILKFVNSSQLELSPAPPVPSPSPPVQHAVSLRTRLYHVAGWLSVLFLVLSTVAGVSYSLWKSHRPPGVGRNYVDDINLLLAGDYWSAVDEMRMAVAVDAIQRDKMLEELCKVAAQHDDIGTQIYGLQELVKSESFSKSPALYTDLAIAQFNQQAQDGKYGKLDKSVVEAARANCRKALEIDPSFAAAEYVAGELSLLLNDQMKADESFRQAARMLGSASNGGGMPSLVRLEGSATARGDSAMKLAALRRMAQTNTTPSASLFNELASALLERQKGQANAEEIREAAQWSQRAIQLNPELAPAFCNLGAALALMKQNTQAAECFRQAFMLDPTLEQARQGLAYVEQQIKSEGKASQ